jgi:hypothetical protein
MQHGFVGEDKTDKDGEADNTLVLSMQPDAVGRRRNQKACCRLIVNCSNAREITIRNNSVISGPGPWKSRESESFTGSWHFENCSPHN